MTDATIGDKVIAAIKKGRCDDEIMDIAEAVLTRRKYLQSVQALENLRNLDIGDIVRVNDNVKPRYLAGQQGVVVEMSPRRRNGLPMLLIELSRGPVGKFRTGKVLFSPSSLIFVRKPDAIL